MHLHIKKKTKKCKILGAKSKETFSKEVPFHFFIERMDQIFVGLDFTIRYTHDIIMFNFIVFRISIVEEQ
jgi:hypothetical protein